MQKAILKTRKVFKKIHTCGLLFAKLGYTFSYDYKYKNST